MGAALSEAARRLGEGLRRRLAMPGAEWAEMLPHLGLRLLRDLGPGAAGIALFLALWQAGRAAYGSFILPGPVETLQAAMGVLGSARGWVAVGATVGRVLVALGLALAIGTAFGLAAGYVPVLRRMFAPWVTILLGMPATAWVILTMLWFGPSHGSIVFTVLLVTTPMLYTGALEGVLSRDPRLEEMAAAFGVNRWKRFRHVALRQVLAWLAPVLGITAAFSFKVAIMAELVTSVAGLGGALARARANMAVDEAMAYIALTVTALLVVEYAAIRPLRARLGAWRQVGLA